MPFSRTISSLKQRKRYDILRINVLQVQQGKGNVSTLMLSLQSRTTTNNLSKSLLFRLGNSLGVVDTDLLGARPPLFHSDLPSLRNSLNDSYCVQFVTGISVPVCLTGQGKTSVSNVVQELDLKVTGKDYFTKTRTHLPVSYHVVSHVPFAEGPPQKKGVIPEHQRSIKSVKGVSCVNQLRSVQNVTNVPLAVPNSPVGSRLHMFWEKWAALGVNPKVVSVLRKGYVLPFRSRPYLTREPTITSCYVDPHSNSYLVEALHQLLNKNAVELVQSPQSLGFYNRLFLVPKPNNRWRPILDLSKLNNFLKTQIFKMETPETIRTSLQTGEWVTSIDFKDAYFHVPINNQSRKYMRFHIQGKTYQFKALPFGLSTAPMEFTVIAKVVKWLAMKQGIRIHQYLDDWLVRARSLQVCRQQTQNLVALCKDLGWLVNQEKSELEPKQIFNFVGYQFNLKQGRVRPTQERWQSPQAKIREILASPVCPVRNFMSLIGLLTATEKQVHMGRLHMKPIQWHLKNNWRMPETLEKTIPIPRSLDPHLKWWLEEGNVIKGQTLHPLAHTLQIFTDASKEGWGAHLNELMARGRWSLPESKLHINYLELKAVLLALKDFQALCTNKVVLIATDNTIVVAYINKEGGMKSGPLCALLWRILIWCTRNQVTLKAQHIPGRLNVIADKLSRLGQTIQTEWSLNPEIFKAICNRWHRPQVDLFAARFNNKLPQFVSPVPDPQAWAVDALSVSWRNWTLTPSHQQPSWAKWWRSYRTTRAAE